MSLLLGTLLKLSLSFSKIVAYFCACQSPFILLLSGVHYFPLLPKTVHADTAHVSNLNLNLFTFQEDGSASISLLTEICSATQR